MKNASIHGWFCFRKNTFLTKSQGRIRNTGKGALFRQGKREANVRFGESEGFYIHPTVFGPEGFRYSFFGIRFVLAYGTFGVLQWHGI